MPLLMEAIMNIGELAERTGLARSRIRFYEARGLLGGVMRGENGYRRYSPESVVALKIITSAQQAGFSLDEIARVLPGDLTQWKHDELIGLLRQKSRDIDEMVEKLQWGRRNIELLIGLIENKPADMTCGDNARNILEIVKHQGLLATLEGRTTKPIA